MKKHEFIFHLSNGQNCGWLVYNDSHSKDSYELFKYHNLMECNIQVFLFHNLSLDLLKVTLFTLYHGISFERIFFTFFRASNPSKSKSTMRHGSSCLAIGTAMQSWLCGTRGRKISMGWLLTGGFFHGPMDLFRFLVKGGIGR